VLRLVLTSAARLFQGEGGSIMLLVDDDELEVVASPSNPAALGAKVHFGEGVSGKVAQTCEGVLVSGRVGQTSKVTSGMCLPLLHNGRIFGVLNINAKPVHNFTNADLEAGTSFGAHAADALAEARLYELDRQHGDQEPGRHLEAMRKHLAAAASVDFIGAPGTDLVDIATIARSIAQSEERAGRPTGVRGTLDGTVRAAGKQVRRLVQELVDNGHLHGEAPVRLLLEDDGDAVVLVVADSGTGIPQDERGRLFGPYERLDGATDRLGLGLGLTIAARLVEGMGGTIGFTDLPVGGAAVRVRLPKAA
jgi:K+-sensing histidine kinase KdpD